MLDPLARGLEADIETVINAKVRAVTIAPAGGGYHPTHSRLLELLEQVTDAGSVLCCTWYNLIRSQIGAVSKFQILKLSMSCSGTFPGFIFILVACCTPTNIFFVSCTVRLC